MSDIQGVAMPAEYGHSDFIHDANIVVRFINRGIERLNPTFADFDEWVRNTNERLPYGWKLPEHTITAELYMNRRRVTVEDIDAEPITMVDTRDISMDVIQFMFNAYPLDQDASVVLFSALHEDTEQKLYLSRSEQRRQIINMLVEACHEEATERELCAEYDALYEHYATRMTFRPAGRAREQIATVTIGLVVALPATFTERTPEETAEELRGMNPRHTLRGWLDSIGPDIDFHEWTVEVRTN